MDNKPIETSVKDYKERKVNLVKLDIILTIALVIAVVLMVISLRPAFKNTHIIKDKSDVVDDVTTTTVAVNDSIDVEEIKSEKFLLYKITNHTGVTKDITLRLNTYVNDEVDNTISRELNAINDGYTTYVYIPVSELGIYDKYDYVTNSSNSLYKSVLNSGIVLDNTNLDHDYVYKNISSKNINVMVLVVYYDKDHNITDIKTYNKTQLNNEESFGIDILTGYVSQDIFIVEAYSIQ